MIIHKLRNNNGMTVVLANYGARVLSILVRDKQGRFTDVALGFDTPEAYLHARDPYFGATVGRFANRIAGGRFTLEGKLYKLAKNDTLGPNHVHGGEKGFSHVNWDVRVIDPGSVEYRYLSGHMEEGYPGNLDVVVRYSLHDDNSLVIDYQASTDASTICNLTHHTFFNLNGNGEGDILQHRLFIDADLYTPVDDELLPQGNKQPVSGTPFDFRIPAAIGQGLSSMHEQILKGRGYCHNYVLNTPGTEKPAAVVTSPRSGIRMEVFTTEPGLQFYSCGFMDGRDIGKGNRAYMKNCAFCLEAQHFPDSPNRPGFPSTVLRPGREYRQRTVYRFSNIQSQAGEN